MTIDGTIIPLWFSHVLADRKRMVPSAFTGCTCCLFFERWFPCLAAIQLHGPMENGRAMLRGHLWSGGAGGLGYFAQASPDSPVLWVGKGRTPDAACLADQLLGTGAGECGSRKS